MRTRYRCHIHATEWTTDDRPAVCRSGPITHTGDIWPVDMPEREIELHEQLYAKSEENRALSGALEAVLLYHRGGPWLPDDDRRWQELTDTESATTKTLCDFVRRVIHSTTTGGGA